MIDQSFVDVLVIGAGPTGSTLAIDLARRGFSVRVIEKSSAVFAGSRAKGLQPRSLEVFEDIGVLDEILAGGGLYPKLGVHIGPFTLPWSMFRNVPASTPTPYPNPWLIPQFRIDAALHRRLAALGTTVEFGTELVSLNQDHDAVTAGLLSHGVTSTVRARYLVGADGGSSFVRKNLGIDFDGSTDAEDRILIVDAQVSGLSRDRWHLWPKPGGRFVGACPLPHSDLFQWMIRLAPHEIPPSGFADIAARVRRETGKKVELHGIQWTSVFRPNIRLARGYRDRRVLIAGDAAHVHTPAGGQGLNTGVQDAYNLGWKLGQVMHGAPEQLLDTYETERRPIAAGVLGLSTRRYQSIGKLDPSAVRRGKDEQQLGISYQGGPLAPASTEGTAKLRAGDRLPDGRLESGTGRTVRLFELTQGPHFTAIAFGARACESLGMLRWATRGAPLRRIYVGGAPSSENAYKDPSHRLRTAFRLQEDAVILVRPDGYVAHLAMLHLGSTAGVVPTLTPGMNDMGAAP